MLFCKVILQILCVFGIQLSVIETGPVGEVGQDRVVKKQGDIVLRIPFRLMREKATSEVA